MNLLSADGDLAQLVEGLGVARSIGSHPHLDPMLDGEFGRSTNATDPASSEAFIRETADTIFHPAGSCAMGASANAPLSADLKVRGMANLRVADASVMPGSISGNINAAVMMVAEKAATMILVDRA
jgi:choline dehydrogenase-like flavoprotein